MATGLQMPQDGLFGLGIQIDSGETGNYDKMAAGYENTGDETMYYFPLTDCNLGIGKQQQPLPDEIGGKAMTFGTFTSGVWAAGRASIIARLSDRLGWVLLATMGEVSTVANQKADDLTLLGGGGSSSTGINSHIFNFSTDDEFFAPWLRLYRKLPHSTATEEVGEKMQDGRIGVFTLNAATGAPVMIDLDMVARRDQGGAEFEVNPSWSATYDDFEDFAVPTCAGYFKINGNAFDITAFSMTINNTVLPPEESLTIGTIDPTDFPLLRRTVTITATILIDNYDLYVTTFTGNDGTLVDITNDGDQTAACTPYKGDVDISLASQNAIGASGDTSEQYKLKIATPPDSNNVTWQVTPIRLVPRRPVIAQITGTVEAISGSTGFYMVLQNDKADYNL